jgi:signal transduction histidine kinase
MLIVESLTDRTAAHSVAARAPNPRKTPSRRCAILPSGVVLLCLALADPAPARATALPLDTPSAATTGEQIARPEPFAGLSESGFAQAPEPVRLASVSKEWKTFLRKTRIDRLPQSLARSLQRLGQDDERPSVKRRKAVSPAKRRYDRDVATVLWQTNQMAIERFAVPQPRPSRFVRDDEAGPVLAAAVAMPAPGLLSAHRLALGAATACLMLLSGLLAYHQRASARQARNRIRSEKAIYDAIAGLPQEAHGFAPAVGTVLDRVEEAYGLSAASITLLDPETLTIQGIYASQTRSPTTDGLVDEAILELHNRSSTLSDLTLWRYPEPSLEAADGQAEPDAITSVAWHGDRTGVMLTAQCRPGSARRATDAKTLQFLTQILAKVIEGRRDMTPSFVSSAAPATSSHSGEELAGTIAHEFNNLLMPIMGYAEMAADALNPGSYPRAYVERIQSAGERAKRVVEQILAFSRQPKHPYGSFDVATATTEILPDLKMCVPASTNFRIRLPDGPVCIRGNALALQQAVLNLCKNAGEAITDGGTVTVGVTVIQQNAPRAMTQGELAAGRYVRVSVSDTGGGIATPDLRRIFDPFFTTRGQEGGTGLGLPMVLRAVKLLDGGINVRSSPRWGTRFDLFFPYPVKASAALPNWAAMAVE